ncbi:TOMM precursor leader peptide-binding protein [Streptomyces calidiresistens]|uniref:TOMM leader peptide-binding protein n=1 Tax=Streptomyces calidiresistens TaxID=1485586 RepID=A0A7W3T0Y4_9ACTN|nr:TOMM precursor leader peptide-binding protein [Streptomyces calidiresistens]
MFPSGEGHRRWLVNTEARLLGRGDDLLVRRGGLVSRCSGAGIRPFVTALLGNAVEGLIDIDPQTVDPRQLARFEQLMAQLVTAGLLVELESTEEPPGPVVMGLWQRGADAVERSVVAERLRTRAVRVLGTGPWADRLRDALKEAGAVLLDPEDGQEAAVTVVPGTHERDPRLVEWNERSLAEGRGRPWLAVTPFDGEYATVGPWIVPGESACYHCYLLRRAATFPDRAVSPDLSEAEAEGPMTDASPRYPGLRAVQVGLVVDRVLEFIGLDDHSGQAVPGGLTTVTARPEGIGIERHRVLRVPRCESCSPATGRGYPQVWFAAADDPAHSPTHQPGGESDHGTRDTGAVPGGAGA